MKYYKIFLFWFIFSSVQAQLSDLARIEYTYFPQKKSNNSFERFRAFIKAPIKLNKKGAYLVPGIEYRNVHFSYKDATSFSTENLDQFFSYEVTLGYTYKINPNWRFAARSGVLIASNFEENKLTPRDFLYSGAVYMIKDQTKNPKIKPRRLILGLQYSTSTGRPFPLPIVYYFKQFKPKWSYALGVPKTNIKYAINKKSRIQALATLDGFFANIQESRTITNNNQTRTANNISMTVALAGLGYEYYISKHFVFYTYTGHTFINDIRLRDNNQKDIFTINDNNGFYLRSGLKFKL